ncbi:uncharacterized protein ACRADG_012788 [Cochliomyia hominivorax]
MGVLKAFGAIFIALWPLAMGHVKTEPNLSVTTSLGDIKGTQLESRLGDKFWAFRGIRYAEPPIGELRFQNPQPVKPWKPKIFDATKDGPICPQVTVNLTYLSEDCLRLNVYTKDVKARKPVIVYLYPGAFYFGGAITLYAGPENLMDRDIVLVTLNNRLGSLGFLATGTSEAAGNMGLKDQVMALRWIQQHIDKFGGDPNSVTLLGYSAGAFSIGLHMMSPMTKGLFHRGIMMSGTPLAQFKYQTHQLDLAERQARLLNCPVKPIKEMIKCLKTKPMMDFVNTTKGMFEFGWNPVLNWVPVIENDCGGNQERYLIEDPYTTMNNGNIHKVPLIKGMNEYEFYYWAFDALRNDTIRNLFNEDIYKYLPIYYSYKGDSAKSREITSSLRSYYFQNDTLKYPESLKPFADLDIAGTICFNFRYFEMASKFTPVYTYIFTYKGRYSNFVDPDTNQTFGAVHHDELLYLLNLPLQTPLFKKTDPENDIIERLTRLWFEFAKKGNPNNASDDYLKSINWPLYSEDKQLYLEIGENLNVKSSANFKERYKLWDRLFAIPEMLNPLKEQSNQNYCHIVELPKYSLASETVAQSIINMIRAITHLYGILIVFYVITTCQSESKSSVIVKISLGQLKGLQMESRLGETFWSFRGIRYAEPPIGELRFQNPKPVRAWKPDIYDATHDGPICPQVTTNTSDLSEDCLRLNVYTKSLNSRKPVIVHLHAGGYYSGAGTSNRAGPENFMDRDIVLVTLNYRLGSLGFLATGTAEAYGNMGLKDQVIALRWIQQHIENFGGDPNSVTLWGYSAGSRSVGLHMLSPMARGLFHKAVMMSASPLSQFKYESNQLDLAQKQARLLKCPESPIKDMVKCMKTKPMMDFVNTIEAMFDVGWNPVLNWRPVIESVCDGNNERYLTEDPYTTMFKGDINKVPLIIGTNEYEFYYMGYYTLRNATTRQYFNQNFSKYSPIYFQYERDSPKSLEVSSALRSFYLQNKTLEFPESLKSFGQLYADAVIGFQYYRFLQMISKHTPVYTYFFKYKGRYSRFVDPDTNRTLGAMHHDELYYLLNRALIAPLFKRSDPENNNIERFTRFWFEFAKKGDPNNADDDYLKVINWPLYTDNRKEYLEIGEHLKIKSNGIFPERFQVWDQLFPISDMLNSNYKQCKI